MGEVVNFKCGCFVTFFAGDGGVKSAMACCNEHETPHQSLDVLAATHDLAIERRYIHKPIPSVDEQFADLKDKFPTAILSAPDSDGDRLVFFECALKGWSKDTALVYFRIAKQYPFVWPDGGADYQLFRVVGDLRLSHGGLANRTYPCEKDGRQDTLFSGGICAWNPMQDTLLTYARVCKRALQEMGLKGLKP
jgi:hypothetical protein